MSRKKPAEPPAKLPPVRRAMGMVAVRRMATKVLQQQIVHLQDRVLTTDEQDFLIKAINALVAATKPRPAPPKSDAPKGSGEGGKTGDLRNPLGVLGE